MTVKGSTDGSEMASDERQTIKQSFNDIIIHMIHDSRWAVTWLFSSVAEQPSPSGGLFHAPASGDSSVVGGVGGTIGTKGDI